VPETADEIRAKTCYDTLLKNRGKMKKKPLKI
jgi:hypothetical protein